MRKHVLFIANSLDTAHRFQQVLSAFDVEVAAASTLQLKRLLAFETAVDLVIFEARSFAVSYLEEVETFAEQRDCALLIIIDQKDIGQLRLPECVLCDFVLSSAGIDECMTRVRRLLGGKGVGKISSIVLIDDMEINLATYQVTVSGEPVDFTYLEYALLAYLVQHPDRTFSRELLLQNVWGLDYDGGVRTVDVHVRRVRAKIGPALAQYLETVRGVGYLWRTR